MSVLKKIMSNKLVKANAFVDRPVQYINTGSLILNVLYSGKLEGGIVKGKVMQIVAPPSLGKSFVAMKIAKNAQKQGMDVLLVDTEFAYDPKFANAVGIDQDKFGVIQTNSIEDIQQSLVSTVLELTQDEKDNLLIIIDSWGNMVTSKTVNDAIDGKDTTDMTISKKKNSLARLLSGLKTTVFVVNQTYETMDQYNPLAVGGGKGLYFVCSSIVMGTSKAKDKDSSGEVTGSIISATTKKGRFCKENSKLKFLIEHNGGIRNGVRNKSGIILKNSGHQFYKIQISRNIFLISIHSMVKLLIRILMVPVWLMMMLRVTLKLLLVVKSNILMIN
jgi:recombination protein RecA